MIRRTYSSVDKDPATEPAKTHQTYGDEQPRVSLKGQETKEMIHGRFTSSMEWNPLEPSKTHQTDREKLPAATASSLTSEVEMMTEPDTSHMKVEDSGREKLQRHRSNVAGRVWIPDMWGQEEVLKDWIDCSAFDSSMVPTGIISARKALVEECRRANSSGLRIEYQC